MESSRAQTTGANTRSPWGVTMRSAIARGWKQVTKFQPEAGMAPEKPRPAYVELPVVAEPVVLDMELVRDERGVRIARDADD